MGMKSGEHYSTKYNPWEQIRDETNPELQARTSAMGPKSEQPRMSFYTCKESTKSSK